MRVLLSTIGSRGDVQPLLALAWQIRMLGQEVHFCVPPDFRGFIEDLGMSVTPIGPELRSTGKAPPAAAAPATADNLELWARDAAVFQESFETALNSHRTLLGLEPVSDVRSHIFTAQPWLAADPVLAPWPDSTDKTVFQSGAWILPDERPLSSELEAFLNAGEPPLYLGFGSIRAPADLSRVMIQTARELGRRALILSGWADLALIDNGPDCLVIGEVNQQALFRRVAAVLHHGGAGTTTAAALAGAPQVIIPQMFDQHYFAERISHLGIGSANAPCIPTVTSLKSALKPALAPEAAARAKATASAMRKDGAQIAAQRLLSISPQH